MSHPQETSKIEDDIVLHEFRPLPDRTLDEQVKALTQIVHQISMNSLEVRLELNDLREENTRNIMELQFLRGVVNAKFLDNHKKQTN